MCCSPPLTRLDSVKSTTRYRPPKGTADLARSAVSGPRRLPTPPARTRPRTLCLPISELHTAHGSRLTGGRAARHGEGSGAACLTYFCIPSAARTHDPKRVNLGLEAPVRPPASSALPPRPPSRLVRPPAPS